MPGGIRLESSSRTKLALAGRRAECGGGRRGFVQAPGVALCMNIKSAISESLECGDMEECIEEDSAGDGGEPARGHEGHWSAQGARLRRYEVHVLPAVVDAAATRADDATGAKSRPTSALLAAQASLVPNELDANPPAETDNSAQVAITSASDSSVCVEGSEVAAAGSNAEQEGGQTKGEGTDDLHSQISPVSRTTGQQMSMVVEAAGAVDVNANGRVHNNQEEPQSGTGHEHSQRSVEEDPVSPGSPTGFFGEVEKLIRVASSEQVVLHDNVRGSSDKFGIKAGVGSMASRTQSRIILQYDASISPETLASARRVGRSLGAHEEVKGLIARGRLQEPDPQSVRLEICGHQQICALHPMSRASERRSMLSSATREAGRPGVLADSAGESLQDSAGESVQGDETRGGGFSRSINAASAPTTFRSLGAEGADDVTLDRPATLPTPVGPVPSGSGPKTLSVASAQAPTAVGDDTARSGLRAILDFTNRPRDEWHSANPQRLLRARCAALSTHALPTGRA